MPELTWIFFDIGNVLFNDERQNYYAYWRLHQHLVEIGSQMTFEQLMREREHLAQAGHSWIHQKIAKSLLTPDDHELFRATLRQELLLSYDENHLFSEQSRQMLVALHRDYRLGIIANQPAEARESLKRRDIDNLFDVIAISDELDMHKPDPQLYSWALSQINVAPSQCLMVGDRLDNDVAPAQHVGMKTALLSWPVHLAPAWQTSSPEEHAYRASTTTYPLFMTPHATCRPDLTINHLHDLPAVLNQLHNSNS